MRISTADAGFNAYIFIDGCGPGGDCCKHAAIPFVLQKLSAGRWLAKGFCPKQFLPRDIAIKHLTLNKYATPALEGVPPN